jgi:membrane associated rhomboid family serine protease
MFNSIVQDIKNTFRGGNMISKIILINVVFFVMINLLKVFDFNSSADPSSLYYMIKNGLSMPSGFIQILKQPWSVLSHMFLHVGFWHILWNMVMLYWFGRIVGDFIGDNRVLAIYIMGGLLGAFFYVAADHLLPGGSNGNAYALGASAAVMAMLWTAASLSPEYVMHLIIIGPVRLKYIAIALFFLDLIGTSGTSNTGGHWAHIGGAVFGIGMVYLLRKGMDLTEPFQQFPWNKVKQRKKTARSNFVVVHKTDERKAQTKSTGNMQAELDRILDKINQKGYENLNDEEKEFLYQVSKKK